MKRYEGQSAGNVCEAARAGAAIETVGMRLSHYFAGNAVCQKAGRLRDITIIRIILMSARPNDKATVFGAFVRKPFAIDVLLACIVRTLEETGTTRAPFPH